MVTQSKKTDIAAGEYFPEDLMTNETVATFEKADHFKNFFQLNHWSNLNDLLTKLATPAGKKASLFSNTISISPYLLKILLFSTLNMNLQ
jgi:hypothetical protein